MFDANEVINGLYGFVYDENGKQMQETKAFEANVDYDKEEVLQAGKLMKGHNLIIMKMVVDALNNARLDFLSQKDKRDWWQMIQLLPSSYNQKRTVQLNYAVLKNIYHARRNHKLDEWHTFCHFIESLPHSELITE